MNLIIKYFLIWFLWYFAHQIRQLLVDWYLRNTSAKLYHCENLHNIFRKNDRLKNQKKKTKPFYNTIAFKWACSSLGDWLLSFAICHIYCSFIAFGRTKEVNFLFQISSHFCQSRTFYNLICCMGLARLRAFNNCEHSHV